MNLIFDYDGTLNNCLKTYRPAFEKACQWLDDNGYLPLRHYSDKEISYWLGFTATEMWAAFQPTLPEKIREICKKIVGDEIDQQIQNGNAQLFEHTQEVLTELKQSGHTLIFLSNCQISYMEHHTASFGLDRFFDFFYCSEEFNGIPKYEIFRRFGSHHIGSYIVIGDRFHDIEIAVKNHLLSIGCAYGYGTKDELKACDLIVNNITEIPAAVKKLADTF